MDTIRVEIVNVSEYNHRIALILNGEQVKGYFSPDQLIASFIGPCKEYELMTCSCGFAGCAGIFDGTKVKKRRYTVEWRDIDCGLPKRFYSFNRLDYELAVSQTILLMYKIAQIRENIDKTSMNLEFPDELDNPWWMEVLNFNSTKSCKEYIDHIFSYSKS